MKKRPDQQIEPEDRKIIDEAASIAGKALAVAYEKTGAYGQMAAYVLYKGQQYRLIFEEWNEGLIPLYGKN